MSYAVETEPSVLKDLRNIDRQMQRRIVDKMQSLAEDPRPVGVEKLTAEDGFRIRVGDYRIVYTIDDAAQVVTITRVGHRSSIYRSK